MTPALNKFKEISEAFEGSQIGEADEQIRAVRASYWSQMGGGSGGRGPPASDVDFGRYGKTSTISSTDLLGRFGSQAGSAGFSGRPGGASASSGGFPGGGIPLLRWAADGTSAANLDAEPDQPQLSPRPSTACEACSGGE